jgi:hypothetical protein
LHTENELAINRRINPPYEKDKRSCDQLLPNNEIYQHDLSTTFQLRERKTRTSTSTRTRTRTRTRQRHDGSCWISQPGAIVTTVLDQPSRLSTSTSTSTSTPTLVSRTTRNAHNYHRLCAGSGRRRRLSGPIQKPVKAQEPKKVLYVLSMTHHLRSYPRSTAHLLVWFLFGVLELSTVAGLAY